MKKFLTVLLSLAAVFASAFGFSACGKNNAAKIEVYAPDGAPALSVARMMSENLQFGKEVDYHVVDANSITSYVTYENTDKNADLCILPVNDASKLIGDGAKYKMLGAVTHGNLYIVSATGSTVLTRENFAAEISGKRLGVVQMAKFPGAMTKLLLNEYGVSDSVTAEAVQPAQVSGTGTDFDYFVIPEPAASTRVNNANLNLKFAGSLQELYGESGYPQAVLVAKSSLVESEPEFIANFMDGMKENATWLLSESVTGETVLNAIKARYPDPENTTPAFNNLSKDVIKNCAVKFEGSADCKEEVKAFLQKLKGVNAGFANEVSDSFFYLNA